MNELTIEHDTKDQWHILRFSGHVDAHTFPSFEEEMSKVVDEGNIFLLIDLEKLTYINSTGLGLLLATFKASAREQEGNLVVEKLSPKIASIFNLLGFNRLMGGDEEGLAGASAK